MNVSVKAENICFSKCESHELLFLKPGNWPEAPLRGSVDGVSVARHPGDACVTDCFPFWEIFLPEVLRELVSSGSKAILLKFVKCKHT